MASLSDIQAFAIGNPELKQRFQAARIQAAWNILAEPNGGTAPRAAWRMKIFNDVNADVDREYVWFLSHPSAQNGTVLTDDAAVVAAVMSFVDAWAAVT